jgi:hypothetical protein
MAIDYTGLLDAIENLKRVVDSDKAEHSVAFYKELQEAYYAIGPFVGDITDDAMEASGRYTPPGHVTYEHYSLEFHSQRTGRIMRDGSPFATIECTEKGEYNFEKSWRAVSAVDGHIIAVAHNWPDRDKMLAAVVRKAGYTPIFELPADGRLVESLSRDILTIEDLRWKLRSKEKIYNVGPKKIADIYEALTQIPSSDKT